MTAERHSTFIAFDPCTRLLSAGLEVTKEAENLQETIGVNGLVFVVSDALGDSPWVEKGKKDARPMLANSYEKDTKQLF